MKHLTLLLATLTGLGAASAFAQTTLPEIADTDGSGAWSLAELQTVWPDMTEEVFGTLDSNADGSVDAPELTTAIDAGTLTVPAQ